MTVYRLRKRGANIVVTANGEVLFMPGGDVDSFIKKFTYQTRRWVKDKAPTNKRVRWAHYGAPLKDTISASQPRFKKARAGARLYAAVGSSAPHAYYVDQGTKPFMAKILPPWSRGSASLYEHTWAPPGGRGKPLGQIAVRGQKAQHYFDEGLKRAFQFMLRSSQQIPTNPKVAAAARSFPHGLANFKGNTQPTAAFVSQLQEWREWRDAAFYSKPSRVFSRYASNPTLRDTERITSILRRRKAAESARQSQIDADRYARSAARRAKNAARMRKWRAENQTAKSTRKKKQVSPRENLLKQAASAANAEMLAFLRRNPGFSRSGAPTAAGFWYVNRRGDRRFHMWSQTTLNKFHQAGVAVARE